MARSRELKVVIAGDAASLNRSFAKAGRDVDNLGKRADGMGKRFSGAMKVAGAAAAGALVVGLGQSVDAAVEAEKVQARLEAQLRASGISYREHAAAIEESIKATSRLSGLDDEDLSASFTNIVRVTGDVNEALRLNALAADLARAKSIDVARAGEIVAKAASGNAGVLKRYGVEVKDGATAHEALAAAQRTFAGQAEAYGRTAAGAADRAKVGFEGLQETVGAKLAPMLAKAANKLADLATWVENNEGKVKALAFATGVLVTGISGLLIAGKIANAIMALQKAQIALNLAMVANPIGLVVAAVVAFGAALVVAYQKSETFRRIVDGAFDFVKKAAVTAIGLIVKYIDLLLGAWSSMLSAVGKVPGFGWAKKAADAIDGVREKLRAMSKALEDVPRIKDVEVRVNARIPRSLRNLLDDEDSIVSTRPAARRQRGGIVPGEGRGDRVPLLAEPGEFIMQRKIVEKFGPTFFAALNEGMVPQFRTSGGIIARANKLDGMRIPYLYGGGHGTRDGFNAGGMDCSASVSYALGVTPRVSGRFVSFGRPGPGKPNDTKVYANRSHVFAVFNGRGWGTSRENPGGGPGWLSYNHRSGFTIRHLADAGGASARTVGDRQETSEPGKRALGVRGLRGGRAGAPQPPGHEQDLADADVAVAVAEGQGAAEQIAAQTSRRGVLQTRLNKVTAALKSRTLTKATRLRLTQERAALISELRGVDATIADLEQTQAQAATDAANDALVAAIEENTRAQEAAREAAEAAAEAERERTAELTRLRSSIDEQNAIAQSTNAIGMREAQRVLADIVTGQLGPRVAASRYMPGSGTVARL